MNILTVSQLNFYVKSIIDSDKKLQNIFVTGEISNLTDHYRSGHIYLSLKDGNSVIKAVMFSNSAAHLKFKPFDGMKVIVRGRVSIYEASGAYQLYIDDMQPDGIGALSLAFEQLKSKLAKEGLFDEKYKRPLPQLPEVIGVITSPTGAAVQDITKILKRRYPIAKVLLCPVLVQGDLAAEQLCNAVRYLNRDGRADVIIIGRGGGSMEDLWAFNDEELAREIFNSNIPVISAVGHETDFTICDFVADVRASTPSAAAELAVPDMSNVLAYISQLRLRADSSIRHTLADEREYLDMLSNKNVLKNFSFILQQNMSQLDAISAGLSGAMRRNIEDKRYSVQRLIDRLDALSPLNVLKRGYAIALKDNTAVTKAADLSENDILKLQFADGTAECNVIKINKE